MKTKRYQCRHIFTAGHRCGSPALRNENFCYYHHTTRKPAPKNRPLAPFEFELPAPEDRAAIQQAIGHVLQRITTNQIDPRRAGLLLYGLQIAASILPKSERPTKDQPRKPEPLPVEEIIDHPELGLLAPEAEFSHRDPNHPKSAAAELLKALREKQNPSHKDKEENEDDPNHDSDDEEETESTLPAVQATADPGPNLTSIYPRLCCKNTGGRPTPNTPHPAVYRIKGFTPSNRHPKRTLTTPQSLVKMQKIHSPIQ